jgi:cytochrome c553
MLTKWFLLGVLALAPAAAMAAGDAEAGKALAAPCGACHGQNGVAMVPGTPNLAGQSARYLKTQLEMIKSGVRPVPLMAGQLDPMSPSDLDNLAAYFATMSPTVGQADGDHVAMGEQIYRGGIAHKSVPACTACHTPTGSGNAPAGFPHIGGQRADYVIVQLVAYREGARQTDDAYGAAMRQVASGLTDGEISALASYIQGLH